MLLLATFLDLAGVVLLFLIIHYKPEGLVPFLILDLAILTVGLGAGLKALKNAISRYHKA